VVGLQDVMPTVLDLLGIARPEWVTGRSVLPATHGESIREFFHGEHSPCYDLTLGMHYLTDGRRKYIWYPVTDTEQLFDLESDRKELHDIAPKSEHADELAMWRGRLVEILGERNDPLTDGKRLLRTDSWYGPEV
jgi:arylsulfatase A-like enzyme